jgi:hypothetical protein
MNSHHYLTNTYDERAINNILDRGIDEIKTPSNSHGTRRYKPNYSTSMRYSPGRLDNSQDAFDAKATALKSLLTDMRREYKVNPPMRSSTMQSIVDTVDTLNFDEMKYEIKDLQDKLSGLERQISRSNSKRSNSRKMPYRSSIPSYLTDTNDIGHRVNIIPHKRGGGSNKHIRHSSKVSLNKSITSLKGSKSKGSTHAVNWMEKFYKSNTELEKVKAELVRERVKTAELEKKAKQTVKKESAYDNLMLQHKEVKDLHTMLLRQFDESEAVRKEQARIIQSMQSEIEMLRGTFDEKTGKLYEDGVYLSDLVKKRKKTKSKTKILKKK